MKTDAPRPTVFRLPNPLVLALWCALFLPGRWAGVQLERWFAAAAALAALLVIISKPSPWETRKPALRATAVLGLAQLLYAASFAYAAAFKGINPTPIDLVELARYAVLGLLAAQVIGHTDSGAEKALDGALSALVYLGLAAFAALWIRAGQAPRAAWPFDDADSLGYAACLALAWFGFFSSARRRVWHFAAALACILLSRCRAAEAGAFVLAAGAASSLLPRARGLVLFLGCAVAAAIFLYRPSVGLLSGSLFLGWGPTRADEALLAARSQYELWVMKGGVAGLTVMLAGLAMASYGLIASQEDDAGRWRAGIISAAVAVMLMGGLFLESYRLAFITGLLAAAMRGPLNPPAEPA